MTHISEQFGTLYHPYSALVFYRESGQLNNTYVEHFDFDRKGFPVNAHPLTEQEGVHLARALTIQKEKDNNFLHCKGILPSNVLHIDSGKNACVMWYTLEKRRNLFFTDFLHIPNGQANAPAMLWQATKNKLTVFALRGNRRPTLQTTLYHAPFFNVYDDGEVCMGNFDVSIKNSASIQEFIQAWEAYFFNSYFSHLVNSHNPVQGNPVQLWKELLDSKLPFPKDRLVKTNFTLKDILP